MNRGSWIEIKCMELLWIFNFKTQSFKQVTTLPLLEPAPALLPDLPCRPPWNPEFRIDPISTFYWLEVMRARKSNFKDLRKVVTLKGTLLISKNILGQLDKNKKDSEEFKSRPYSALGLKQKCDSWLTRSCSFVWRSGSKMGVDIYLSNSSGTSNYIRSYSEWKGKILPPNHHQPMRVQ